MRWLACFYEHGIVAYSMSGSKKNIVCIGGGAGISAVLMALKKHPVHLTAIVSMADDGQSQAVLRDTYHVLPPSDIRKALIALADESEASTAFQYRFKAGPLDDFTMGNLFLAAFQKSAGSIERGIAAASKLLGVRGDVIAVTLDDVRLTAELEDGTVLHGETNIDISSGIDRAPIKRVWLTPDALLNPRAAKAITEADVVILGPGDVFTSIVPNLLVKGMPETLRQSKAKKIYLVNLMTKPGETRHFTGEDFVKTMEQYLGGELDCVIFNGTQPSEAMRQQYASTGSELVVSPVPSKKYLIADILHEEEYLRHDSGEKLANTILNAVRD